MKNKLLITALLAATTLWACSGSDSSQSEGEELVKKVNVVTQTLRPQSFSSYVRVVGTVETSNDIMISAEVSGKVVSYRVDEGDFVKKGQTILKSFHTVDQSLCALINVSRQLAQMLKQNVTSAASATRLVPCGPSFDCFH